VKHRRRPMTANRSPTKMLTIAGAVKSPATLRVPLGTRSANASNTPGASRPTIRCSASGGDDGHDYRRSRHARHENVHRCRDSNALASRHGTQTQAEQSAGQDRQSACDHAVTGTSFVRAFCWVTRWNPIRSCGRSPSPHGRDYFNQWPRCAARADFARSILPEDLFPKEACDDAKSVMRAKQMKWTGPMNPKPHAMADGRHVPIKTLAKKMHMPHYDLPAPLLDKRNFAGPPRAAAEAKRPELPAFPR